MNLPASFSISAMLSSLAISSWGLGISFLDSDEDATGCSFEITTDAQGLYETFCKNAGQLYLCIASVSLAKSDMYLSSSRRYPRLVKGLEDNLYRLPPTVTIPAPPRASAS